MRLRTGKDKVLLFPVSVGRPGLTPTGTFRTGADPKNRGDYVDARRDPPIYGGQPFVRLNIGKGIVDGTARRPYGIHGQITPSLIWGRVTAGCVRVRLT
jgi:lipoprotein-anchoring transpeptidase ErfK/SrfK